MLVRSGKSAAPGRLRIRIISVRRLPTTRRTPRPRAPPPRPSSGAQPPHGRASRQPRHAREFGDTSARRGQPPPCAAQNRGRLSYRSAHLPQLPPAKDSKTAFTAARASNPRGFRHSGSARHDLHESGAVEGPPSPAPLQRLREPRGPRRYNSRRTGHSSVTSRIMPTTSAKPLRRQRHPQLFRNGRELTAEKTLSSEPAREMTRRWRE